MKKVKLFLFIAVLCLISVPVKSQAGIILSAGKDVLSNLFGDSPLSGLFGGDDDVQKKMLEELKAIKATNAETLAKTIIQMKETYELVHQAQQSTALLDALATVTKSSEKIMQNGGFLKNDPTYNRSTWEVEAIYSKMTIDALLAVGNATRAYNRLRNSPGEINRISSTAALSNEIASYISESRRCYLLAVQQGDDVSLSQAERISFLERADEAFSKASSKIIALDMEATAINVLAEQREISAVESQRNTTTTTVANPTYDPAIPAFK